MKHLPDWLKDWLDFQDQEGHRPSTSARLNDSFRTQILKDLKPTPTFVASKVSAIHLITALGVLMVCPQLGFGGFLLGHSLMEVFMTFGHEVCFVLCGILFLGSTMLMTRVFLSFEERREAHRYSLILFPTLLIVSLAALKMLGNWKGVSEPWTITMYWIAGSLFAMSLGLWLLKPRHSS